MRRQSTNPAGIAHQRVTVRKKGERLFFDLHLPENAEAFTSITVIAGRMRQNPAGQAGRRVPATGAGHLALRWDRPGDVFFMQKVDLLEAFEQDHAPLGVKNPGGTFWNLPDLGISGTRLAPSSILIPRDCRLVRGAYTDEINQARGVAVEYNVDIYLRYFNRA